jgi:TPR repeat protein
MIAGVLAVGILWAGAVQARADTAPPDEPPDVAGLAWREACHLPHAHVRPPLAAMPNLLFEDWGLPRSADDGAWTGTAVLLLGRAYEMGLLHGAVDKARAAQLYCLALRRSGNLPAAAFLSRLHARGAVAAFLPGLAGHFARVAAIHGDAARFRAARRRDGQSVYPADRTITRQLARAQRWLARVEAEDPRVLETRAMRYLAGDGLPRSDLLGHHLYRHAAIQGAHRLDTASVTARYVTGYLDHHVALSTANGWHRNLLLTALYNAAGFTRAPMAQRVLGQLHLQGVLVPKSLPAAVLWLRLARTGGASVTHDIGRLAKRLPAQVRQAIACRVRLDDPPYHPDRLKDDRGFHKVPEVCRE